MAIDQSRPYFECNIDIKHVRRHFNVYIHCGDTSSIRFYLFEAGKQWIPDSDWIATLGYASSDFEFATSLTTVTGQIADEAVGTENQNYVQFDLTGADTATSGDYFAQVKLSNADSTEHYIFGDGSLRILPSPLSGSYTAVTLTEIVNWDVITNTGTLPWPNNLAALSELDAVSNVASSDLMEISQDQGSTYISKKVTFANVVASLIVAYANAVAQNNTIFLSTGNSKLVYKDSAGTTHDLY